MVSVCLPYWRRQGALDRMLKEYATLYADLPLEIVVADDGSPEPAVVATPLPWPVTVVPLPEKDEPLNPCVPLNRAVAASRGDVVVLTSPEISHRTPVLCAVLAMLEGPDDYVTAACLDERLGWLAGERVRYDTGGRLPVPPGAHFHFLAALRRELWERAGGFDEDYRHGQGCDDNDWLWRLHRVGARFRTCPAAVYHDSRERLRWGLPFNGPLFQQKWPEAAR